MLGVRDDICILSIVVMVTGCVLVDYKRNFEDPKNAVIGLRIDDTVYRRASWIRKGPDILEYGFKDSRGCSYVFEVVSESRVIRSWRYLSDAKLCWSYVPTAVVVKSTAPG